VALLDDLISRTRLEIGDGPIQFTTTLTGDGVTKDFYADVKPLDALYLTVKVNGVVKAQPTDFTVEEGIGVVHFVTPPGLNSTITISGTHYRYFTTAEITKFVNTAVLQHTYHRSDNFGSAMNIALLPPVEEYPIAILSSIEGLWALATDAAFDINITAPDGVVIPRNQRFMQLSQIINSRTEQYRQLCSVLNIGLWRIEIGTLRRVSRTTNKMPPVYVPQEVDDARRPNRVWLPNDLTGYEPIPEYAGIYDIVLYQGDSWSAEFDFPFDVTNLDFKAQVRTYPNSPSLYATFTIAKIDAPNGKIRLSLDSSTTTYMPVRAFWDLQATNSSNPGFEQTYVRGQVFTQSQVTLD
jgi:hypothetical protein